MYNICIFDKLDLTVLQSFRCVYLIISFVYKLIFLGCNLIQMGSVKFSSIQDYRSHSYLSPYSFTATAVFLLEQYDDSSYLPCKKYAI